MLGIGIDIIEISRMAEILERSGNIFLRRVFTSAEQGQCMESGRPDSFYAATFAAKEAVFKLFGTAWEADDSFLDIEIIREKSGAPSILLHRRFASLASHKNVLVSLSSDGGFAAAVAALV